jgi:Cu(I)/Ag(I) efflux system membrane fusion protein
VRPFLVCLFVAACGGSEPAKPKIEIVSGQQPAHASAAQGAAFADAAVPCCDTEAAAAVVQGYTALSAAMAADDAPRAQEAARALSGAVARAAVAPALPPEQRAALETIAARADAMNGRDLPTAREELLDMTDAILLFARAHRGGSGPAVALAFCPMKPGRWLQSETAIRNPYYGAEMLECGVFEKL